MLFPRFYETKCNSALKVALKHLIFNYADEYGPRGFRSGAPNELKTRGPHGSTVATRGPHGPTVAALGEWRSLDFRGYVDRATELGRDMSKLLAETDKINSDDVIWVMTLGATSQHRSGHWALGFRGSMEGGSLDILIAFSRISIS